MQDALDLFRQREIWRNFLKQFFRNERASKVVISVLQQIYALGDSFQVRSIWTFEP